MTEAYSDWGTPVFTAGDRMAKAASVAGLSASAMAKAFGVSPTTISNWTSGRTKPSEATMRRWALMCRVPFEWLRSGAAGPGTMQVYELDLIRLTNSPELDARYTGQQDRDGNLIMSDGTLRAPGSADPEYLAREADWLVRREGIEPPTR